MKKLQEELVKERAERERLEDILLNNGHLNTVYKRCGKCQVVQPKSYMNICQLYTCIDNNACKTCINPIDWAACYYCKTLFCPDHDDHFTQIKKCDYPGCITRFCECRHYGGCKHNVCHLHCIDAKKCHVCHLERYKNAKRALVTTLGLLRRKSICHKDICREIFNPLFLQLYYKTKFMEMWSNERLSPSFLKKKQLL